MDDRLVFHNYRTGMRIAAAPVACEILHRFPRPRSVDAVAAELTRFRPTDVAEAVETLVAQTLLEPVPAGRRAARAPSDSWSSWHPAAGFFHFSTKDVPFETDEAAMETFMRKRLQSAPAPPAVKRYRRVPSRQLPPPATTGEFPAVLRERRTWRRFGARELALPALATLLGLSFGVQRWLDLGGLGRAPLKTSPSAGARHPIEAYVAARRVAGLEPGLYHYQAAAHHLELLRPGADSAALRRYLAGQSWYGSAAALVIMTAVFGRTSFQYPYPRAYRSVLLDAGHLCQTFCLVATWLGLAPFCSAALADSVIERDLGLDGTTESVIYAAGVGTRPKGVDWAPAPPTARGMKAR
jgi:SagB-type dehydrogenase family enzyme